MKVRLAAVSAVVGLAAAMAGCGGESRTYDISPIFPASPDKCARYGGDQEGSGPAATCMVTEAECKKAAADWKRTMDNRNIPNAINFSCGPDSEPSVSASAAKEEEKTETGPAPEPAARVLSREALKAFGSAQPDATGVAVLAEREGSEQLITQAQLAPSKDGEAYEVWLYNSPSDAKSLGAQVTDRKGKFQGAGPLPTGYSKYRYIDISVEDIDQNQEHSGRSVLRGKLP